jgi:hypothetical protein
MKTKKSIFEIWISSDITTGVLMILRGFVKCQN